ncbi:MAG: DNA recombination protein RmuC [Phycisphaerales bacterium]|nr:DNA recombination protein RmuC [Phycisphaerales bacterium]
MDGISILVGMAVGVALGGAAGFAIASSRGRTGSVAQLAAAEARLAAAEAERERLLEAGRAERDRADAERTQRGVAEQRVAAVQSGLAEREKAIAQLKQQVEESRQQLVDAFKATGADVLRVTTGEFLKHAAEQFAGQSQLSEQAMEARQKAMNEAIKPLSEHLAKSEQLVKELSEKREGDAKQLSEQLKTIAELQMKASSAAQTLGSALRNTSQRGKWGEVGLRTVVELAGLEKGVHFTEQVTIDGESGRLRPDMIVLLPGGRSIPIDSKVPLDAYLDSLAGGLDDARREELRTSHATALRKHVSALARKDYALALGQTLEFTVLYLPVESAFTASFEADPDLHEFAFKNRVLVATPSTLLCMLKTVAMSWSDEKLHESALEIRDAARELVKRTGTLVVHMNATGTKLGAAVIAFNDFVGSFDTRFVKTVNTIARMTTQSELVLDGSIDDYPKTAQAPQLRESDA